MNRMEVAAVAIRGPPRRCDGGNPKLAPPAKRLQPSSRMAGELLGTRQLERSGYKLTTVISAQGCKRPSRAEYYFLRVKFVFKLIFQI